MSDGYSFELPKRDNCRFPSFTLEFLRMLKFKIEVDEDNKLIIEKPDRPTSDDIVYCLQQCRRQLVQILVDERRFSRKQFHGGPIDGQKHNGVNGEVHVAKVSRAKWAAYFITEERGEFAGYATSERKAKILARQKQPEDDRQRYLKSLERSIATYREYLNHPETEDEFERRQNSVRAIERMGQELLDIRGKQN